MTNFYDRTSAYFAFPDIGAALGADSAELPAEKHRYFTG